MSIFTRAIAAVTPAVVSTSFEAVNGFVNQWAKEAKSINEAFSEDRVKVKMIAEKARLMADAIAAEKLMKKSATSALTRAEVAELNALYASMFSDADAQPIAPTTVELL